MWNLGPINDAGTSFFVWNGTAHLARAVVDPALPWVLVEGHTPHHLAFTPMLLPLSERSLLSPRSVRASSLRFDLLLRTDEFLAVLDEVAAAPSGGIMLWQLDREPKERVALAERMFDPSISGDRFTKVRRDLGARLMLLCPHAHETSKVSALDPADLHAAWERVREAANPE